MHTCTYVYIYMYTTYYLYIYIHISVNLSLSLSLSIYIYIYMYIHSYAVSHVAYIGYSMLRLQAIITPIIIVIAFVAILVLKFARRHVGASRVGAGSLIRKLKYALKFVRRSCSRYTSSE